MNTESATPLSILIIDDDPAIRSSLSAVLLHSNYSVVTAESGAEGIRLIKKGGIDIAITDLKLADLSGIEIIKSCSKETPIILMTAYGDTSIVSEAVRAGAYDYLSKPLIPEELLFSLRKFEEREKLKRENATLKDSLASRYSFGKIVAHSKAFKEIFETVKRLSQFDTTTLITGESGTGKELLARAIHENSTRRGKPFVAINCGAIPESLMESELFGHKKGAFTDASRDKRGLFEEADGGTLFLDEVGELPLSLQVKLLRALQERSIRRVGAEELTPINVRVVSATLRNLDTDVASGRFREDLFYRLNVVSIHLPPLRERREDIPLLIEHFTKKHSERLGLTPKQFEADAMKCMLEYHWRGNARELENCIERALVLSNSELINLDALPESMVNLSHFAEQGTPLEDSDSGHPSDELSVKKRTRDLEIELIKRALKKTAGNRTHAAKILELSHRALLYKLKEYGLSDE